MNKRMKELAEQAGFYVANGNVYIPTINENITDCLAKYAELVVKECAHVGFNAAYPKAGVDVLVAIKQHFGVE